MKLTKQGVRDLDSIGPKKVKVQNLTDQMPIKVLCNHEFGPHHKGQNPVCKKCGEEKGLCW